MESQEMIRVVLADDHPGMREGLSLLLALAKDIDVVGEARNGAEALQLVEQLCPHVLVLDVELPVLDGIQVAEKLQEGNHPVGVLAISAYDEREYILNMLGKGATGYLIKDDVPEYLIEAVRGVARGERGWVSERAAKKLDG